MQSVKNNNNQIKNGNRERAQAPKQLRPVPFIKKKQVHNSKLPTRSNDEETPKEEKEEDVRESIKPIIDFTSFTKGTLAASSKLKPGPTHRRTVSDFNESTP
jgi:hypothetical protein